MLDSDADGNECTDNEVSKAKLEERRRMIMQRQKEKEA